MITGRNPKAVAKASSFEEALDLLKQASLDYEDRRLLYRGHGDESWKIIPSLFRQKPDIAGYESEIIRDLISLFPSEFLDDRSMFDRLVRMQHYGLPTRLLDVTKNPLVAMYFAVDPEEDDDKDGAIIMFAGDPKRHRFYDSDTVSSIANLANLKQDERDMLANTKASTLSDFNTLVPAERLHQFIKDEKPYFLPKIRKVDLFRPVSVTPKRSNHRIAAQSGQFVIFGLESKNGPKFKKTSTMVKIAIEASAKPKIRERLDQLGIDGSTLFPEIDRAAKRLTQRYLSKAIPF